MLGFLESNGIEGHGAMPTADLLSQLIGAASDGRVRDLLSGRELAGTSPMARRASSRQRGTAYLQEGGGGRRN